MKNKKTLENIVDLIASGYEWVCPKCETFNREIEVTEAVKCKRCQRKFGVASFEHSMK